MGPLRPTDAPQTSWRLLRFLLPVHHWHPLRRLHRTPDSEPNQAAVPSCHHDAFQYTPSRRRLLLERQR